MILFGKMRNLEKKKKKQLKNCKKNPEKMEKLWMTIDSQIVSAGCFIYIYHFFFSCYVSEM